MEILEQDVKYNNKDTKNKDKDTINFEHLIAGWVAILSNIFDGAFI